MSDTLVLGALSVASAVSLLTIPWDLLASRCLGYFLQQVGSEESLEQRVLLCPVPTRKQTACGGRVYQQHSQTNIQTSPHLLE